jgi:5-methylcytosine-specific restriction endonuclease McrA
VEIFYYPEGAKTIEDRVSVGDLVKALVSETRKKHAKKIKRARLMSPTCQLCGERALQYRSLEAHHVKPLWVSALEIVMTAPPQNHQEYREMFYNILAGKIAIPATCHDADQFEVLCRNCHNLLESKSYKSWKEIFTGIHRLVWNIGDKDQHRLYIEPPDYWPRRR